MHFLFLAAQFEFMTRFPAMILYFSVCTGFTAGPNIKWDVLHALQFCTGRYSYGQLVEFSNFWLTRNRPSSIDSSMTCYFHGCAPANLSLRHQPFPSLVPRLQAMVKASMVEDVKMVYYLYEENSALRVGSHSREEERPSNRPPPEMMGTGPGLTLRILIMFQGNGRSTFEPNDWPCVVGNVRPAAITSHCEGNQRALF